MFKKWDRVIYNCPEEGVVNEKATVLGMENEFVYQLRMDKKSIHGYTHSCCGKCEDGYGKYAIYSELTLITNKEQPV